LAPGVRLTAVVLANGQVDLKTGLLDLLFLKHFVVVLISLEL
jgi:hypothetical protein